MSDVFILKKKVCFINRLPLHWRYSIYDLSIWGIQYMTSPSQVFLCSQETDKLINDILLTQKKMKKDLIYIQIKPFKNNDAYKISFVIIFTMYKWWRANPTRTHTHCEIYSQTRVWLVWWYIFEMKKVKNNLLNWLKTCLFITFIICCW